jgi:thioredoxin reductase (NADPH)
MTKPAILVVDDDAQVLRAITRDVRQRYGENYRILRAESGAEAVEALDQLIEKEEPVALVLSDQRMPRMDGVALLTEARTRFPEAKRALLTAYADTDAAIGAINKSQIDYYLRKPWDPPDRELYPVLDDLLSDWQANFRPPFEGVRVIGDRWSRETHVLKDFLARNRVPYVFLDVETSDEAKSLRARLDGDGVLPLVVLEGGEALQAPTTTELAGHVGLSTRAEEPFYDLAIVGGGPAGLAAAVYGGSEGLRTIMIEQEAPGGQAGTSSMIENYLGFPAGLSGADLARRGLDQAKKFEVEMLYPQEVCGLAIDGPYKRLQMSDGGEVVCHVLLLAMGVSWRLLDAPGADALTGRGVYFSILTIFR